MPIMKMLNKSDILFKKITQTITPEEEKELLRWGNESVRNKKFISELIEMESFDSRIELHKQFQSKSAYKNLLRKIKREKQIRLIRYSFKYAAILILAIGIPSIIYNNFLPKEVSIENNGIKPGERKATLILSDGKQIELNKEEQSLIETQNSIVKNTNSELVYTAKNVSSTSKNEIKEIKYNTLITPIGGEYHLTLSDGSLVVMNSGSTLTYPEIFTGDTRKVTLEEGEAYFDVSSSKYNNEANFIVVTKNQEVEVLGTQFNIKAYREDIIIATTLAEGKVAVTNTTTKETKSLKPNQQLKFNTQNNQLSIETVDLYNEISWKDGFFKFKDKSLKEIMTVLSRWYDIDVIFEDKNLENIVFTGSFSKQQNIKNVLEIIKNADEVVFLIKGKTIRIKTP